MRLLAPGAGGRPPRANSGIAARAAAIGCVVGSIHALAEAFFAELLGARVLWLDVLLAASAVAVAFAMVVALACAAARWKPTTPVLRLLGPKGEAGAGKAALLAIGCGYFLGAVARLDRGRIDDWAAAILLLAWLALLWSWARRSPDSFGQATVAIAAVVLASVGVTVWVYAPSEFLRLGGPGSEWLHRSVQMLVILAPAWAAALLLRWGAGRRFRRPAPVVSALLGIVAVVAASISRADRGASGAAGVAAAGGDESGGGRPNVVLIVLDTVSARHLGTFNGGISNMPRLARFAGESCDLVRAIAASSPWTPSSHASMFTGRWPSSHGCRKPGPDDPHNTRYCLPMRNDLPTLAEWLASRGYRTGMIAANPVLGVLGLGRGFAEVDTRSDEITVADSVSWTRHAAVRLLGGPAGLRVLPEILWDQTLFFSPFRRPWRSAASIGDAARAWLERGGGEPHFLFLNLADAHGPYYPRSAYARLRGLPREVLDLPPAIWERHERQGKPVPPEEAAQLSELYDDGLHDLDHDLAPFLAYLRSRPDFDRTLLVITSDHGEEFMEHGHLEHSTNVYEPQTLVPFFARLPRPLPVPLPEPTPAFQDVDFIATIASVIGEAGAPDTQGSPWGGGRSFALSEVFASPQQGRRCAEGYSAVRIGPFKYVQASDGADALYDLSSDPAEAVDVSKREPRIVAEAREIVRQRNAWLQSAGDTPDVVPAELQKLRSLGYVN